MDNKIFNPETVKDNTTKELIQAALDLLREAQKRKDFKRLHGNVRIENAIWEIESLKRRGVL